MIAPPDFVALRDFAAPPYRLSGTVYGTLLNHGLSLTTLGNAVNEAPYKALPKAPVLHLKPRNTLLAAGQPVTVPLDAGAFEVGVSLGIVIGRTACRVMANDAASVIAGYTMVVDFCVLHASFYRPSVRFRARDGSCHLGPDVVPAAAIVDANALAVTVVIDGAVAHQATTSGMVRPVAQLLADVTDFMTLVPGDVLMLGVAHGAPVARAGQRVTAEIGSVGRAAFTLIAETPPGGA